MAKIRALVPSLPLKCMLTAPLCVWGQRHTNVHICFPIFVRISMLSKIISQWNTKTLLNSNLILALILKWAFEGGGLELANISFYVYIWLAKSFTKCWTSAHHSFFNNNLISLTFLVSCDNVSHCDFSHSLVWFGWALLEKSAAHTLFCTATSLTGTTQQWVYREVKTETL